MYQEDYIEKEYARVEKNLYKPKRAKFGSSDKLAAWYIEKLKFQEFSCFCCETSIFDINKLIVAGLLKTRAARGGGRRGSALEINKNDEIYEPENSVLSCYYCNNDKSYILSKEDYINYFGKNRQYYFKT